MVNSNDVKDSEIRNPNETMIKNLNDEIKEITQQYNNNIALYQKMIRQPKQTKTEKALYSDKKNYLQSEINKFQIIAPFDGVIGSININAADGFGIRPREIRYKNKYRGHSLDIFCLQ